MTVNFTSMTRRVRVYYPEHWYLCGFIWLTKWCLWALSYNGMYAPVDVFMLVSRKFFTGWVQRARLFGSADNCFPELVSGFSFIPVPVLLFTQLWSCWSPWESWPFLTCQGLQWFHCFLKTSSSHIQRLLSFPGLWLYNICVAFLCLLYYYRKKTPWALLRYNWQIKTIYIYTVKCHILKHMCIAK